MLKVGVGASTEKATLAAAATAARRAMDRAGLAQADFALVFATIPHSSLYGRMLERIAEVTRTRHLVGCSTMGIVTSDGEVEDEPAVAVLALASDTLTATPFLVRSLRRQGGFAARRMARMLPAPRLSQDFLMLFPDTMTLQAGPFLDGLSQSWPGVPAVGGGASENGTQMHTYQWCGTEVASDAVCGALFSGGLSRAFGHTVACRPIGEPLLVTRAEGHVIFELSGRPAYDVFTGLAREWALPDLRSAAGLFFLGFPCHPEHTRRRPASTTYATSTAWIPRRDRCWPDRRCGRDRRCRSPSAIPRTRAATWRPWWAISPRSARDGRRGSPSTSIAAAAAPRCTVARTWISTSSAPGSRTCR